MNNCTVQVMLKSEFSLWNIVLKTVNRSIPYRRSSVGLELFFIWIEFYSVKCFRLSSESHIVIVIKYTFFFDRKQGHTMLHWRKLTQLDCRELVFDTGRDCWSYNGPFSADDLYLSLVAYKITWLPVIWAVVALNSLHITSTLKRKQKQLLV